MYGIRGARITELMKSKNGGILKAKTFAGHSSASTTINRYEHDMYDVDEFINQEAVGT